MMKNFKFLLITFLISCAPEHDESIVEIGDVGTQKISVSSLLEAPENIVFSDVYNLVLKPSCVSCHGEGRLVEANVNLTTLKNLLGGNSFQKTVVNSQPEQSSLYETLIVSTGSRHMPPFGKPQLSKDQINLVYQWILGGAKEERLEKTERAKSLSEIFEPYFSNPQTIDYAVIKEHVFDSASCTKCHSSDSPLKDTSALSYGQDMTTYESLFKDESNPFSTSGIVKGYLTDRIKKDADGNSFKEEGSRIYRSVAVSQSMPPSRDGYLPVNSLRVKLLRLWILNCAIEDYESIKNNDTLSERALLRKSSKVRDCVGI